MSDGETKKGCTVMQIAVAVVMALSLISAAVPAFNIVAKQAHRDRTARYSRSIIAVLKLYADDHNGVYPDAHTPESASSNDAFRLLFQEGKMNDECVFGAMVSPFQPDGHIGSAPDFPKALEAGENHWAMSKGVTTKSDPQYPLVFENPASPGWPPMWNADAVGRMVRGRAWRGGKIIVGFNDGSAQAVQLESSRGTSVGPKTDEKGKDCFTRVADKGEMLDVLE